MNETTVNSLPELLSLNTQLLASNKFFCYRGQSNSEWELIPSMYRELFGLKPPVDDLNDGTWISEVERDLNREFERHAPRFASERWSIQDRWHRLFLSQHYGIPTRLLDWTKNILVAAYFSVSEKYDADAAIWCLNVTDFPFPKELGRLARNKGHRLEALKLCVDTDRLCFFDPQSKVIIPGSPAPQIAGAIPSNQSGKNNRRGFLVVIEPPVLEDRIKNQQGLFSIYVAYEDQDFVWNHTEYIKEVEQYHSIELFSKIVIPKSQKSTFKIELERSGFDPNFIFPDLAGLVMMLKQEKENSFNFYLNERKKWFKKQ
jgi:hypothetical protein